MIYACFYFILWLLPRHPREFAVVKYGESGSDLLTPRSKVYLDAAKAPPKPQHNACLMIRNILSPAMRWNHTNTCMLSNGDKCVQNTLSPKGHQAFRCGNDELQMLYQTVLRHRVLKKLCQTQFWNWFPRTRNVSTGKYISAVYCHHYHTITVRECYGIEAYG